MAETDTLTVTIVGKDIFELADYFLKRLGMLNSVSTINRGMLGNFNSISYIFEIPIDDLMSVRRDLMNEFSKESAHLMALYEHGDPTSVYVFKRFALRTRSQMNE